MITILTEKDLNEVGRNLSSIDDLKIEHFKIPESVFTIADVVVFIDKDRLKILKNRYGI